MIEVNRAEIALFVEVLFRYCDGGHVSLRAFRDDVKSETWNPSAWSWPQIANGLGDVVNAAIDLAEAASAAPVPVVFAPIVATFKSADGAAEKDVREAPALSEDCDENPSRAREILEDVLGPATVTVATGGLWTDPDTGEVQEKVHVHWRLTEPARDFADHVKLKEARRLAMVLVGADASGVPLVHPLRWPGSVHRKAEPRLARILDLRADIEIELDDALELLREAVAAMPPGKKNGAGCDYTAPGGHQPSRFGPAAEALDIISALAVIANDEKNWKRWSDIGMAVWRASGGSEAGYVAWFAWSSKFDGFDPATTRERWEHYPTSPPGAIGAGTLFYLAREGWPGWEKPSDTKRRRDNDPGDPPPHLDQPPPTSENVKPDPDDPEPQPARGEEGSDSPSVATPFPDGQDRADQAQRHWGSAEAPPSFRDPWAEPPRPQWPADVLPVKYHDMLFELAHGAGVDPGAQGVAALCSVSGAAPKNARFFPYGTAERWTVPPIIWAMIIAPSGQRKTALNSMFEALRRKHSLLWREYRAELRAWRALSYKERNDTPKPPEPHSFLVTDTTPEKVQHILAETDRGTLWLRDELAGFFGFGRYGNDKGAAERAFYLESYEGGSYTVHRITRDSFLIEINGLTVFGHIQPDRLNNFRDLQSDGLLQRFITIRAAQATVGHPLGTITGKSEFDAAIGGLAELRPSSAHPYRTTREGSDIIRRMEVDGIEFATLTDYGPGFSGFCGKLHGTLARLALLLHLLEQPDPILTLISPDTVLAAERLVREFVLPHTRDFYATLAPDRGDLTRDIAGWLLTGAPARVRASDFGKHIWACRRLDGDGLNTALDPLVTGGWLEPEILFPANRKWRLHPQVRTVMAHRVAVAAAQREANRQLVERLGRRDGEK